MNHSIEPACKLACPRFAGAGAAITVNDAMPRRMTILFYDMVDSTTLANQVGVEELLVILRALHSTVTRAMKAQEGFVARYMGDGGVAYFGWPAPRADAAERAVYAALRALDAVAALVLPSARRLHLRIGIATGVVVVDDVAGTGTMLGMDVVGVAPNVAARLEALAPRDTIVVDEATRRLAGDGFAWRGLGSVAAKGIGNSLRAWQVGAPSTADAPARAGAKPMPSSTASSDRRIRAPGLPAAC
jgi:class 3 adenylate cyclase